MYVIDASEKGGMVETLLLVRGCAPWQLAFATIVLQGGPLLVKTRVVTPIDVITPVVWPYELLNGVISPL